MKSVMMKIVMMKNRDDEKSVNDENHDDENVYSVVNSEERL
jgi:hypothetical protein